MGHKFYYMGTMACKCNCRDHEKLKMEDMHQYFHIFNNSTFGRFDFFLYHF